MKHDLTQYVADAMTSPAVAKAAATATTGIGISTVFGWLEKGVGLAAALMGLAVTIAIYRKLKMEADLHRRESELRIKVLESQVSKIASGVNHE
jgi:hypothetical protein